MSIVILLQLFGLFACIPGVADQEQDTASELPDSGAVDSGEEDTGGGDTSELPDSGVDTGEVDTAGGDSGETLIAFTELATGDCWSGCADLLDTLAASCPDPWVCCDEVTIRLAFSQSELDDVFADELPAEPVPVLGSDVALLSFSTRCPQSGLALAVSDIRGVDSALYVAEDLHYPPTAYDTVSRPYNVVTIPPGDWESALATVTRDW